MNSSLPYLSVNLLPPEKLYCNFSYWSSLFSQDMQILWDRAHGLPLEKLPKANSQILSDNCADFIDKSEPPIDTKLVNHLNPSNSTLLNEVNNEAFDLKTYKKFLSFLKFQEMTEKYDM